MSSTLADVELIYADNPGSLPASHVLAEDVNVQSIVARIDGSGAASSFLPTLSLYSQDGKLIVRVPSDLTYSIGDTGVVSWSPFLARRVVPSGALSQYSAKVRRAVTDGVFNVPDGFAYVTNITWTTVEWDPLGMWNVANPTRLTAPVDGVYLAVGVVNYNGGFAGSYGAAIRISNSALFPGECQFSEDGIYFANIQAVGLCEMSAGDYVELTCEQKTGAARPLLNDGSNFSLNLVNLHP